MNLTKEKWTHQENDTCFAIVSGDKEIAYVGKTMRVATIEEHKDSKQIACLMSKAPEMLRFLESLNNWAFQNKHDKNVGPDYSRAFANIHGFIQNNGILERVRGL